MDTVVGIIIIILGLILLVFRARISQRAVEDWARFFPRVKIHKFTYDFFLWVGGVASLIAGTMILLGFFARR
jgi:hypothetical protein